LRGPPFAPFLSKTSSHSLELPRYEHQALPALKIPLRLCVKMYSVFGILRLKTEYKMHIHKVLKENSLMPQYLTFVPGMISFLVLDGVLKFTKG
jgi:hypothetical protein